MATQILTNDKRQTLTKARRDKPTTLSREHVCDNCGEPAMTREGDHLRCPSCWLREQGRKIKPLDRGGYRP